MRQRSNVGGVHPGEDGKASGAAPFGGGDEGFAVRQLVLEFLNEQVFQDLDGRVASFAGDLSSGAGPG